MEKNPPLRKKKVTSETPGGDIICKPSPTCPDVESGDQIMSNLCFYEVTEV